MSKHTVSADGGAMPAEGHKSRRGVLGSILTIAGGVSLASALDATATLALASTASGEHPDAELFAMEGEIDAADSALDAAVGAHSKAQTSAWDALPPRPTKPDIVKTPEQDKRDREMRAFINQWCDEDPNLAADAAHQKTVDRWQEERERLEADHGVAEADEALGTAGDAWSRTRDRVAETPATTLEGLIFKTRYAASHYSDQYEEDVMASIVDDLLALGGMSAEELKNV